MRETFTFVQKVGESSQTIQNAVWQKEFKNKANTGTT